MDHCFLTPLQSSIHLYQTSISFGDYFHYLFVFKRMDNKMKINVILEIMFISTPFYLLRLPIFSSGSILPIDHESVSFVALRTVRNWKPTIGKYFCNLFSRMCGQFIIVIKLFFFLLFFYWHQWTLPHG